MATHAIVKTIDGLHSKLYWTPAGAVIGSSNASSNGLGFEGRLAAGNFELNVLIRDSAFLGAAARWFDELWQNERIAHAITPKMILAARDVYSQRQTNARRFMEDNPRYVDSVEQSLPVGTAAERQQALLMALDSGPRTIEDLAAYLGISPKKVRNAIDAIRGKNGRYHIVSLGQNKFGLKQHAATQALTSGRLGP